MGLPAQVQKQLDDAEALQARLARAQVQPQSGESADDPTQEQTAQQEPVAPEADSPKPESRDEFQLLEQRYKSLQGMWQSAEARLRQSQAQVGELTQRVEELSAKIDTASPAPTEKPASALVTDKDAEAFGPELIDLTRRVVRDEFVPREQQLLGQIKLLEDRLAAASQQVGAVVNHQVEDARGRFFASLDGALPNWEALQASPEGQAWLVTRVPGTSMTWNDSLQDAAQNFDTQRALEVFNTFLAVHPKLDRRRAAPQSQSRPELARQVAPARAAAASSTPEGRKVYSSRDYAAQMDRVIQLHKERKYDDATALEHELGKALAEGRVAP